MTTTESYKIRRIFALAAAAVVAVVGRPALAQTAAPGAGIGGQATAPSSAAPTAPPAPATATPTQPGAPGSTTNPATATQPGTTAPTAGQVQSNTSNANTQAGTPKGQTNLSRTLQTVSKAPSTGSAEPVTLTLAQAIEMTLKASTALAIATRNLDRDAARVDEAKAAGGPRAAATATGTHFDGPTKITFGATSITALPQDTALLGVNASLPIDISGQIRAQTDVARIQALADRFARDTVYNSLVLEAQTAYFGVLRAQHQVQVAQAALSNAQAQQTLSNQQYQAGTGQRIDVLRANTQVATAQQNLTQAKNSLALAQITLNDAVGRPLNAPTGAVDVPGVTTGVAATPMAPPTAPTATPPVAPTYFHSPIADVNAIDVDQSIQTATNARPELRQDLVNIQAAERSIKLAKSSLSPSLTLQAGANYNPTTSFSSPRQRVAEVTANLDIPLFDSGLSRARVREARDTAQNARDLYGSHTTDVAMQVRQAYLNLQTAAQQIDAANVALQQAVAARQLAQTRYQGGVGLYLEVTDAESALTSAETNQVNAVYTYLTARAQFQNALGTPDLNPSLPTAVDSVTGVTLATPPALPPDITLYPGGSPGGPPAKLIPPAPPASKSIIKPSGK